MLVESGLIILADVVVWGRAAGARTTDISRPPDASIGATSMGKRRRRDDGSGV